MNRPLNYRNDILAECMLNPNRTSHSSYLSVTPLPVKYALVISPFFHEVNALVNENNMVLSIFLVKNAFHGG
jgi:hypothetical protein